MSENLINRQAVARMLGVDVRTLTEWQKLPDNPLPVAVPGRRGAPHQYDPQAVVAWYVARQIGKLTGEAGEVVDPQAEKARLDRLRADAVEFDLAVKQRKYAPVELITFAVSDWAGQAVAIIEALPKRIKQSMPQLRAREIKILEKELVRMRNALADVQVRFDRYEKAED